MLLLLCLLIQCVYHAHAKPFPHVLSAVPSDTSAEAAHETWLSEAAAYDADDSYDDAMLASFLDQQVLLSPLAAAYSQSVYAPESLWQPATATASGRHPRQKHEVDCDRGDSGSKRRNKSPRCPNDQEVIDVTGEGAVQVSADIAQVRLAVEVKFVSDLPLAEDLGSEAVSNRSALAKSVMAHCNNQSAAVVAYLLAVNASGQANITLQTTGIRLEPVHKYSNIAATQLLVGYRAVNSMLLRVAATKAGPIIQAAIEHGANRIDSVSFVASDYAVAKGRNRAISVATSDAIRQATMCLRSALGRAQSLKLSIVNIRVTRVTSPNPEPAMTNPDVVSLAGLSDEAIAVELPPPVLAADKHLSAQVAVRFRFGHPTLRQL